MLLAALEKSCVELPMPGISVELRRILHLQFLQKHQVTTQCIDLNVFHPTQSDKKRELHLDDKFVILPYAIINTECHIEIAVSMNENNDHGIPVPDYVEENVSTKVVKIIQSYTGIVNKMVWRKIN